MSWAVYVLGDAPGEIVGEPAEIRTGSSLNLTPPDVPQGSIKLLLALEGEPVDASPDVPEGVLDSSLGAVALVGVPVDAAPDVPTGFLTIAYPTQTHGQTAPQPRPRLFPGGMRGYVTRQRWNQEQQRYEFVVEQMPS